MFTVAVSKEERQRLTNIENDLRNHILAKHNKPYADLSEDGEFSVVWASDFQSGEATLKIGAEYWNEKFVIANGYCYIKAFMV